MAPPLSSIRSSGASAEEYWVRLTSDSLHDFMSPVNQLGTIADLMLRNYRGKLDSDAEALLGFIQTSAGRLQNLAAGLTTYIRVAGSPGPYRLSDANALLTGAVASMQPAIDDCGAAVTQDRLPEVYCDPTQLTYVFASLIENSIKFRSGQRPEIHVSAAIHEDEWIFSVRDNGLGIDPLYKDRIFGLFKRIHNETYPGAGVGLAISREIVEQHSGRIWVESETSRGATFWFTVGRRNIPQRVGS